MKLNIQLPLQMKELNEAQKEAFIEELRKALELAPPTPIKPVNTEEHSIWTLNDEELLGLAEEDFYNALITPSMNAMASLIAALGLSQETVEKSFSDDFMAYEDVLIKSSSARNKISELMELSKKKKQAFLKYLEDAGSWTKKKLKEIDRILSQKIPDADKLAEEYAVRAAFIAKIRNQADTEALEMTGAFVDRFPKTIEAAKNSPVVVNQRQKDSVLPKPKPVPPPELKLDAKTHGFVSTVVTAEELEAARKEWKTLKVLPLQPQEIRTVQNAEIRTAEKIAEVTNRHKTAIKQIVLQAINGRWSSQKLAQELFDQFGDMNRDWRRVALTELAMATNDAYLAGLSEGNQVMVPSVVGSCKHCQKYLEGKTFTYTANPKLMGHDYNQEMHYVWVGKTNYGRKVATYVPCVPLHPSCRHRYHKLSKFYKMVDNVPVLKDVKTLIQEERARRGLPPDPNL